MVSAFFGASSPLATRLGARARGRHPARAKAHLVDDPLDVRRVHSRALHEDLARILGLVEGLGELGELGGLCAGAARAARHAPHGDLRPELAHDHDRAFPFQGKRPK